MNRKKPWYHHVYFLSVLTAIYVLFIFSNSMKPGAASSADSKEALRLVRELLAAGGIGGSGLTEHLLRKAAHFTEYAVLGALLWSCLKAYPLPLHKRVSFQAVLGFFVPFADETIQLFVPGRSGQISDVWLDAAGVAAGSAVSLLFFLAAGRLAGKKRGSKDEKKL